MENPSHIKNNFYIKVNKKRTLKGEKRTENQSPIESTYKTNSHKLPKSIYNTEIKSIKSGMKSIFSPINKEIKLWKLNKSNEKSNKESNKKYKKKLIHIEDANKYNLLKSPTQFPLENKNLLTRSQKLTKTTKNFLSPANINLLNNINTSKKINPKVNTDLRINKNFISNYEQNSAIKLSTGKLRKNFYYPNFKNMEFIRDYRLVNKNIIDFISTPKYSKTIISNNSQSIKKKKNIKKYKNKSKEEENNNDKKIINIYKTKLVTIFVKLMEEFYKKRIRNIFNFFIYKFKSKTYFFDENIFNRNKKINNITSKNQIFDYNTKKSILDTKETNLPNSDYQSMTMYRMKYNKKEENNDKKIYIPIHNRYEENIKIRKYFNNVHSNPKYKIFNDMKINKNPKKIEDNNNNEYKNQNINTQINNYYNTKNTNYYFNKINSFNSLVIEKQRPRHYYPKNNLKQSPTNKKNDLSLNSKKNINNNINTPKTNMKNLIYKKILSKENKNKIYNDNIESSVNKTEKIIYKQKSYKKYKNVLIKDKDYMLNYYTTIAKNIKDNYNKNNNGDLSNDFYNYCLEDIDKPMNMIYSKNEFEDDENSESIEINNLIQTKSSDRRLFMNFNYIKFIPNRKRKEFVYEKKNQINKNKLFISKTDSIFILNNYGNFFERDIIKNNFISIIEIIINDIIFRYKSNFFKRIKELKFKSIIYTIFEIHKNKILKKYFDIFKDNINTKNNDNNRIKLMKDNNSEQFNYYMKESIEKANGNSEDKNKYEKKFELFRINLLKYIFCKK